jgi:pimeloyl-ACP methyl ester carboxylesterase
MPLFGLSRMLWTGLLGVGLWVAVFFLFREWSQTLPDPRPPAVETRPGEPPIPDRASPSFSERVSAWRPGADASTAYLAGAIALTLIGLGGGRTLMWLFLPKKGDDPRHERVGDVRRVKRPDGTELHVEISGNPAGPTVVLTHAWGTNATEWYYLRRQLADRYRVVAWDLPGLGKSRRPDTNDYSLDKLADDLDAVLDEVGGPVVLVGHSIGGMITLTFATKYRAQLGSRVAGLVAVHTTHTNPLKTTEMSGLYTAIQKPILEPLAYVMMALSPAVWLSNAMSYLNGTQHFSVYRQVFSWAGTWGQLDFVTRYVLQVWPAVYARGMLGMFRSYHVTDVLGTITVPVLVVAGDRDRITKWEASKDITSGVPQGEMATLTPGGHVGLISSHEEFGRVVEAFLGRCLGGRATAAEPEPQLGRYSGSASGS